MEQYQDYLRALARKISRELPSQVEFEELVACGQLGLVEAARNYRPELGHAFTTFSYYRIRGAIFDGLRKLTWLPPEARRKTSRMGGEDCVAENTATQFGPKPDPESVAHEFSDAVRALGAVFLLAEAGEGGEAAPEPVDSTSAADEAEKNDLVENLREALTRLSDDQRSVIEQFYFSHKSMTEIARERGVNKSSVSRVHHKALLALRQALGAG